MKEILAARKKPLEKITIAALGVTTDGGVRVRGTTLPEAVAARVIDGSDPPAAVEQLLAALRSEGVL
jgi:electron transfer flavoprotein beta subunit